MYKKLPLCRPFTSLSLLEISESWQVCSGPWSSGPYVEGCDRIRSNSPYLSKYFKITVFHQKLSIHVCPLISASISINVSWQDSYHPALGTFPPPPSPTRLFKIPENCTPFSAYGPVCSSRQQFSQNYSCIKPEHTKLWHCIIMYSKLSNRPGWARIEAKIPNWMRNNLEEKNKMTGTTLF